MNEVTPESRALRLYRSRLSLRWLELGQPYFGDILNPRRSSPSFILPMENGPPVAIWLGPSEPAIQAEAGMLKRMGWTVVIARTPERADERLRELGLPNLSDESGS